MILGFKTKFRNGKPTMFAEQIINGLLSNNWCKATEWSSIMLDERNPYKDMVISSKKVKIHTLREDAKNRWVKDVLIDFYIGVRTKNAFRFAPRVPVLHVQKVEIIRVDDIRFENNDKTVYRIDYYHHQLKETFVMTFQVLVDGKALVRSQIQTLAKNDGFETAEDFFAWFDYGCWRGKIIHWTCLKY